MLRCPCSSSCSADLPLGMAITSKWPKVFLLCKIFAGWVSSRHPVVPSAIPTHPSVCVPLGDSQTIAMPLWYRSPFLYTAQPNNNTNMACNHAIIMATSMTTCNCEWCSEGLFITCIYTTYIWMTPTPNREFVLVVSKH